MNRGDVPDVAQWAKLKQEGWTVESWNAEMDQRRADNAEMAKNDRVVMLIGLGVVVFGLAYRLVSGGF